MLVQFIKLLGSPRATDVKTHTDRVCKVHSASDQRLQEKAHSETTISCFSLQPPGLQSQPALELRRRRNSSDHGGLQQPRTAGQSLFLWGSSLYDRAVCPNSCVQLPWAGARPCQSPPSLKTATPNEMLSAQGGRETPETPMAQLSPDPGFQHTQKTLQVFVTQPIIFFF